MTPVGNSRARRCNGGGRALPRGGESLGDARGTGGGEFLAEIGLQRRGSVVEKEDEQESEKEEESGKVEQETTLLAYFTEDCGKGKAKCGAGSFFAGREHGGFVGWWKQLTAAAQVRNT